MGWLQNSFLLYTESFTKTPFQWGTSATWNSFSKSLILPFGAGVGSRHGIHFPMWGLVLGWWMGGSGNAGVGFSGCLEHPDGNFWGRFGILSEGAVQFLRQSCVFFKVVRGNVMGFALDNPLESLKNRILQIAFWKPTVSFRKQVGLVRGSRV